MVKASIPVVTVALSLLSGESVSLNIFLTMLPTVFGVGLAASSDSDFTPVGFGFALASTVCQALMNVRTKVVMKRLDVSGSQAQFLMACVSSVVICVYAGVGGVGGELKEVLDHPDEVLVMAVLAYHLEYSLNFLITERLAPVAFSVVDIARRLAIIVCGSVLFIKELSVLNIVGVIVALFGVLSFSLVTMNEKTSKEK